MAVSVLQRRYWSSGGRMGRGAVVVGAGVAGLASAISLARTGWQVTVLERSPELGEVGAGLAMTPNAVAAFRGLGFGDDDVAALGYPTRAGGIRDLAGRPVLDRKSTRLNSSHANISYA